MKKLVLLFVFILFITSCISSRKLMEQGRYDEAFSKSLKNFQKNPSDSSEFKILQYSFQAAYNRDLTEIDHLKQNYSISKWDDIIRIIEKIRFRQQLLLSSIIDYNHGFSFVDCETLITQTKNKASEDYYRNGIDLLKSSNIFLARKGYYALQKSNSYIPNKYPNIQKLMNEAKEKGTSVVLVQLKNATDLSMNINKIAFPSNVFFKNYSQEWVDLIYCPDGFENRINFTVTYYVDRIYVSPLYVSEEKYNESKEVEDGFENEIDEKGNVKKDSLGNEIKRKKYKTITCKVLVERKTKEAKIEGEVEISDLQVNSVIHHEYIEGTDNYKHTSVSTYGNTDAISAEVKSYISGFSSFSGFEPSNYEMVNNALSDLYGSMQSFLYRNAEFIGGE